MVFDPSLNPSNCKSFIRSLALFKGLEEKFKNIHGNKYDYSEVVFKSKSQPIKVFCNIHHSYFYPTVYFHLKGTGCKLCSFDRKRRKDFVKRSQQIHGDIYDYSKVDYTNDYTKVKLICKIHDHIFDILPTNHLFNKQGCPICNSGKNRDTDMLIKKFKDIHKDNYNYLDIEYKKGNKKQKIFCNSCNTYFMQTSENHLRGQGCPVCNKIKSKKQIYKDKPATLYYVKVNNYFKVGITLSSVEERFKKDILNGVVIECIETWNFNDGFEAFKIEQKILNQTKKFKIKDKILFGGNTEIRKEDFYNTIVDIIEGKSC